MSTLHANGPDEVPARIEALGALAGMPREAVHAQLRRGAAGGRARRARRRARRCVDRVGVVVPDPADPRLVRVVEASRPEGRAGRAGGAVRAATGVPLGGRRRVDGVAPLARSLSGRGSGVLSAALLVGARLLLWPGRGRAGAAPRRGPGRRRQRTRARRIGSRRAARRSVACSRLVRSAVRGAWVADFAEVVAVGLDAGLDLPSAALASARSPGVGQRAPWLAVTCEAARAAGTGSPRARRRRPGVPAEERRDLALLVAAWRLAEEVGAAAPRSRPRRPPSVRAGPPRRARRRRRRRSARVDAAALRAAAGRARGRAARRPVARPALRLRTRTRARGGGLLLTAVGWWWSGGCCAGPAAPVAPTGPAVTLRGAVLVRSGRAASGRRPRWGPVGPRARAAARARPPSTRRPPRSAWWQRPCAAGSERSRHSRPSQRSTPALRGASSPWWRPPIAGARHPTRRGPTSGPAGRRPRSPGTPRTTAGAAPAGLLTAAAGRMRAEESRRVEAAVHRAGVLLVLPLGRCFLPGFVATTVAPVVLHLLGGLAR